MAPAGHRPRLPARTCCRWAPPRPPGGPPSAPARSAFRAHPDALRLPTANPPTSRGHRGPQGNAQPPAQPTRPDPACRGRAPPGRQDPPAALQCRAPSGRIPTPHGSRPPTTPHPARTRPGSPEAPGPAQPPTPPGRPGRATAGHLPAARHRPPGSVPATPRAERLPGAPRRPAALGRRPRPAGQGHRGGGRWGGRGGGALRPAEPAGRHDAGPCRPVGDRGPARRGGGHAGLLVPAPGVARGVRARRCGPGLSAVPEAVARAADRAGCRNSAPHDPGGMPPQTWRSRPRTPSVHCWGPRAVAWAGRGGSAEEWAAAGAAR